MIYQIKHMRVKARLTEDEMLDVLLALAKAGYVPALLAARQQLCATLGVARPGPDLLRFRQAPADAQRWPRPRSIGDVFVKDDAVFYLKQDAASLYMMVRDDGELRGITAGQELVEAGVIGVNTGHLRRQLADFCKQVNQAIAAVCAGPRLRTFDLNWKDDFSPHQKLRHLISRNKADAGDERYMRFSEATFPDQVLSAAKLLADPEVRETLALIQQTGKLLASDLAGAGDPPRRAAVLAALREHALIHTEWLLLCSKTGLPLTRLPSREMLKDPALANLVSPASGKRFAEERLEEILTLTDRARWLLDADNWLRIYVIDAIEQLGYARASIAWNQGTGDHELDLALQPFERLVFIKVRAGEFSLTEAYAFNFCVTRYGGEVALLIATGGVSNEARKVLLDAAAQDQRGLVSHTLHVLDSLASLPDRLREVFAGLSVQAVRGRIDPLSSVAGVDLGELIMRKLSALAPVASTTLPAQPPLVGAASDTDLNSSGELADMINDLAVAELRQSLVPAAPPAPRNGK